MLSSGRIDWGFPRLGPGRAAGAHETVPKDLSQAEYEETVYYQHAVAAKNLVESLAPEESKVYIDIDDEAHGSGCYRGHYGRIVAIVYVKREGRWINVNAKVLNQEYPIHYDPDYNLVTYWFDSEFDPLDWLQEDYLYV